MEVVYIFLAEGFEEVEALTPCDLLRRAGIEVGLCSVYDGLSVKGRSGITVIADLHISELDINTVDGVVLPGGMPGSINLDTNEDINEILKYSFENKKLMCAICAAPFILGKRGYLNGKKATCYPSFEKDFDKGEYVDLPVVADGNIITAKAAGASVDFGLEIIKYYKGAEKSKSIADSIFR